MTTSFRDAWVHPTCVLRVVGLPLFAIRVGRGLRYSGIYCMRRKDLGLKNSSSIRARREKNIIGASPRAQSTSYSMPEVTRRVCAQ